MKTNEHEKTAGELLENEENLKDLMFRWAPKSLRTSKGRSALRHREKQRAKPEIVRKSGLVNEFNKTAKVSKSSKHGKNLKPF